MASPIKNMSGRYQAWYLIHCQPRKERYAAHALKSLLDLAIFLPEYKTRSRGETRTTPFFPGYIFVQADLQQVPISRINATPGVIRLVAFGDDPQPVPIEVISMIDERLSRVDQAAQPLQPGDIVHIKQKGPLQDLEMVFVGPVTSSRRVAVLLNLLGRLKEIYVDIELLEKVSGTHTHTGRNHVVEPPRSIVCSA